jgi:hypothetical protein
VPNNPKCARNVNVEAEVRTSLKNAKLRSGKAGNTAIPSVVKAAEQALKLCDGADVAAREAVVGILAIASWCVDTYEEECHGDSYGEMAEFISDLDDVLASRIDIVTDDAQLEVIKDLVEAPNERCKSYGWELTTSIKALNKQKLA